MNRSGTSPAVLITDAGRGSALAFIRALGRRGWRVIAADSDPASLGFRSRYARTRMVYPSPERDPGGLVAALLDTVRSQGVNLLIPVTDDVILPLDAAREQFAGLCTLAMPERAQLDAVTDKLQTLALAERLGVPAPRTVQVRTVREARAISAALGWPLVVKPQASRVYRDRAAVDFFEVSYAGDADRLAAQVAQYEGRCPVLLQEYYPGEGHGVELLMHQGRPLAAFQHRRLREVPPTGGASSLRESVPLDPAMLDHSVRLLAALEWTGLAMVEFKVGAQGPRLMEINGRIWGSLPLAVRSGMDFPGRMAELYLYGPPQGVTEPDTAYRTGVRARNTEKDVLWILSVLAGRRRDRALPIPARWRAIPALLGFANPAIRSDTFWWRDPLPGLAEIPHIWARLSRKRQALQGAGEAVR